MNTNLSMAVVIALPGLTACADEEALVVQEEDFYINLSWQDSLFTVLNLLNLCRD